jgi:hypothetical protein
VASEELRKAKIKRQDSLHVTIIPRLMKPEWFRLLYKALDMVFDVLVGAECWPSSMLEPLIVGISFPFIRVPPWQLRGTPKMFHLGRKMRRLWERLKMDPRHILGKLPLEYERLRSMWVDVVRRVLFFESKCAVPRQESGGRGGRKRKQPSASTEDEVRLGKQASGSR